jgi:molecular chaperone DnaK (HSP70)
MQKLRREVEKAKRALSSAHQTRVEIESLMDGEDFSESLTRAKFEELNMDLFKSTMTPVKKVLEDAELTKKDIDEVILVGGSTRIPKVQALVKEFFNGKEPSRGVNPDEAVAYGAAVQACILSGNDCGDTDMVIIDTVPLSLGIETVGGVMTKVITRNTAIPTKKSQVFSTAADNQNTVTISVYEGERPMIKDNHFLGKFDMTGIPPAPRGVPQLEVTFSVDANGMLQVSAKDKGTDKEESITITNDNNRLNPEDIERMLKEAEQWADEDKIQKEKVDSRNELEQYAYSLKRQVDDKEQLGGKISEEDKTKIVDIVEEKLAWLKENEEGSAEDFKGAKKEIEDIAQPIISALYQKGGQGGEEQQGEEEQQDGHAEDEL